MTAQGAADSGSRLAVGPRWPWALTAAALVVAGSAGAWATANNVANDHADRDEHHLVDAAEAVVSDLREAFHHHADLTANAAAWAGEHRAISDSQLRRWAAAAHIAERHPRVLAIAIVPVAGEPSAVDLTAPRVAGLTAADDDATCALEAPEVVDPCALRRLLEVGLPAAEDLGTVSDSVVASVDPDVALISTPIYSGATVPTTPAARSAQFEGVVVAALDAQGVLDDAALTTDSGLVARLEHRQLGVERAFTAGELTDAFDLATSRSIGHGWTVQIYTVTAPAHFGASTGALWILFAGLAISLLSGSLVYMLGTDRSRALRLVATKVDELEHQALHDALTGLPNRALVTDRLEQLIVRSRRHGTVPAVLHLDIDGFRNINDTLGHEAGDELLDALASRLGATLRNVDTLGRMGGDEFVVLLDGATFTAAPTLVAERLLEVSRQPFTLRSGTLLHVTISIGIAIDDQDTAEDFLRAAEAALTRAKAAGRNRYEVFLPEMQASVRRRVELEFDLRSALENDEFELVYQPIYNLDDLELLGAEALLRWHHPRFGEIKPEAFIPILEQTGQIVEVGRWVLNEACREVASWHRGGSSPGVSVDVSGRQFDDDTIIDHVREALESSGLPAASLTIEMTEGAIMRNHIATARRLVAIKQLGVKIAIDDFGTGYSSFAYLREFPIDSLKIDRTFTNGITRSAESQALVRTLVQLGRDLGMKTVAEGVETEEEMDRLRVERVDEAQGYLLARPLSAATFRDTILGVVRA